MKLIYGCLRHLFPLIYVEPLFLDNAKYHKAESVFKWLEEHPKLQVEFLPTYAQNLNLIERFWRLAKEKLVRNSY